MPKATFLRLLDTPIPEKGTRLREQIADLNAGRPSADVFPADPIAFSAIPDSPFAYWVGDSIRQLFIDLEPLEGPGRHVALGLSTKNDVQFVRLYWELNPETLGYDKKWCNYANGSITSPFFFDFATVVLRENNFSELRNYICQKYPYLAGSAGWILHDENDYIQPAITWPLRSQRFSPQVLPPEHVFSARSYAVILENKNDLLWTLGFLSAWPIHFFFSLKAGFSGRPEYVTGTVRGLPCPKLNEADKDFLASSAKQAYVIARTSFLVDEISHVFCLPALLHVSGANLAERLAAIAQSETERQHALAHLQAQIDNRVAELYGVPELSESSEQLSVSSEQAEGAESAESEDESDDEAAPLLSAPYSLISDFLMWCVGVAFGRWDVRYALNPERLPSLPEPFDPLPVYSPGRLLPDSQQLTPDTPHLALTNSGYLVDDPDRPQDDIVAKIQNVLYLLWGEQAEAIEREACQVLGIPDLRTWFRDPKGFFAWHIKRYSKSRRKAPIYWLIQSARKNYAIWLYYPRLNHDSLYFAAREYADAKRNREVARLDDLQNSLDTLKGASRKIQEKKLAAQIALVAELKVYIQSLDSAALLDIQPDLNDGVLLNLAPLRELVPWKEPARIWDELLRGKYAWSHISSRLRQKKLIKGA